jgi:LPXTG-motif cell wall-anchored protein
MKKTEVTRLPQTGPAEFMLLALLAIMLAFGFQRLRKQS